MRIPNTCALFISILSSFPFFFFFLQKPQRAHFQNQDIFFDLFLFFSEIIYR